MNHFDTELAELRETIIEMMSLAKVQLEKAKWALIAADSELAEEIIHNERRMNSLELSVDRDCENLLALFQPVATDLRFIISLLKINSNLERIGDYADGIADYVVEMETPILENSLAATKIAEMFDIAIDMMSNITMAFYEEDSKLAKKVYKKDKHLNKINFNSSQIISDLIIENPENTRPLLFLFSTIRKLERVGDHIKNIAEAIIFHLDAEILKLKKKYKNK